MVFKYKLLKTLSKFIITLFRKVLLLFYLFSDST